MPDAKHLSVRTVYTAEQQAVFNELLELRPKWTQTPSTAHRAGRLITKIVGKDRRFGEKRVPTLAHLLDPDKDLVPQVAMLRKFAKQWTAKEVANLEKLANEQSFRLRWMHFRVVLSMEGDDPTVARKRRLRYLKRAIKEKQSAKRLDQLVKQEKACIKIVRPLKSFGEGHEADMLRQIADLSQDWMRRHDESWLGNESMLENILELEIGDRVKRLRADCEDAKNKLKSIANRAMKLAEELPSASNSQA